MVENIDIKEETRIQNFQDLRIWQEGINVVKKIYELTPSFPKEEIYGLTSQMRRCAVSIPSNIAEGFKRFHNNEFRQFLYITLGSCAELETQLIIADELDYIDTKNKENIIEDLNHISRMIYNLIKKL
jgi:four helix bundle protein